MLKLSLTVIDTTSKEILFKTTYAVTEKRAKHVILNAFNQNYAFKMILSDLISLSFYDFKRVVNTIAYYTNQQYETIKYQVTSAVAFYPDANNFEFARKQFVEEPIEQLIELASIESRFITLLDFLKRFDLQRIAILIKFSTADKNSQAILNSMFSHKSDKTDSNVDATL